MIQNGALLTGRVFLEEFKDSFQIVNFRKDIKTVDEAKYVIKSAAHKDLALNNAANSKIRSVVINFNSDVDKAFESIMENGIDKEKVKTLFSSITNSTIVSEILTKVQRTLVETTSDVNPLLYFSAKKHFIIAKILYDSVLSKVEIKDLENTIDEINKEIKAGHVTEEEKESFGLGYFTAIEPAIIPAVFSPYNRDDEEFITTYSNLVDKYTYIVAQQYPEQYLKLSELDKRFYSKEAYMDVLQQLS